MNFLGRGGKVEFLGFFWFLKKKGGKKEGGKRGKEDKKERKGKRGN